MSHELRTPLSAILGLSEAILHGVHGPLNERQSRSMKIMEDSGRHLLELINDILDLSKIEAGRLQVRSEPIAVGSLCTASLALVQEAAVRKQISLTSSVDPRAVMLRADPKRLKQVLVNLLSNAVKFTPDGGSVTLTVMADPAADVIRFRVEDTGVGIAAEDMKRLFRPFVQLDSSLSRRHTGTGLGLSLVHRLTALQGGGIEVQSEVGEGSTFIVSLPWPPEQRAFGGLGFQSPEVPLSSPAEPSRTPVTRRILLVEDSEANIEAISVYLEAKGHKVKVARNGVEALAIGPSMRPDIVLMDIQMPGMDGLEVTRRFRREPVLEKVPILAVTALAMIGDRERCLEAGADEFLSKPLNLAKLVQTIEEMTSPQRGTSEDSIPL
jgi:CheY-like chemotaxis protein